MTVPVRISESRTSPVAAKSVQLSCPKCGLMCEAVYPWNATVEDKIRIRHDVITDHVKVCTVATGEVLRVWDVQFPRL